MNQIKISPTVLLFLVAIPTVAIVHVLMIVIGLGVDKSFGGFASGAMAFIIIALMLGIAKRRDFKRKSISLGELIKQSRIKAIVLLSIAFGFLAVVLMYLNVLPITAAVILSSLALGSVLGWGMNLFLKKSGVSEDY